jgi:hypothetical protein
VLLFTVWVLGVHFRACIYRAQTSRVAYRMLYHPLCFSLSSISVLLLAPSATAKTPLYQLEQTHNVFLSEREIHQSILVSSLILPKIQGEKKYISWVW